MVMMLSDANCMVRARRTCLLAFAKPTSASHVDSEKEQTSPHPLIRRPH